MAENTLERIQTHLADRYTFERELGRGGMATVFLARDIKHDRQVAIKVLHPDLSASIGGDRFEREIRVAGRLQHPHILGMYDSGVSDGLLYYVMPFVEGESLRDKIDREGQLQLEDALQITLEVADALEYAHKQQVIHRDIKPENILLSGGHALVADFGIARAVEDGAQLTQTGMALGTPTYMAPEQGMGEKVGPQADVYSLGCMLFEMLAGDPPFTGKNSSAILAKHVMEQVPSVRIIRQSVPEEVEYAIFAALGKSPADRPQTAGDFAELLVAVPSGHTSTRLMTMRHTTARRTMSGMTSAFGVAVPLPVPLWRRPLVLGMAALLLAAGGFGAWKLTAGKGVAFDSGALSAKSVAVLYFEALTPGDSLAALADGLTETLIQNLSTVQGLSVVSAPGAARWRDSTTTPPDSIARALAAGTLVRGTVEALGENVRVTVRLLDGNSGVDLERKSFVSPASNFAAIRDSTAQEVASLIRTRIGSEFQLQQQRQGTNNADAWLLVQRAERQRKAAAATTPDSAVPIRAQADSLLMQAEALDPKWADPIVARATLSYEASRRSGLDPLMARDAIDRGLAHADRALAVEATNANALEIRGTLSYWRWLLGLETDPGKADALIQAARRDLEKATEANPNQTGAWASLSHLYYNVPDGTHSQVNIAARRAWEADAFLSNAETVLTRLFLSSYDLESWPDASRWCREMGRRFPTSFQAPRCQLFLLTSKAESPDVARAWALADSVTLRSPESRKEFQRLNSHLLVAAVIARSGNLDSAKRVVDRSLGNPEVDPSADLAQFAAFVDVLRDDRDGAIRHLTTFLSASDRRRTSLATNPGWWYRPLANDPAFLRLVGATK